MTRAHAVAERNTRTVAEGTDQDMSRPAKILEIKGEKASETTVKCSDIDFNIHTNSARYIKWQIDTYSLDDFKDRQIKRFDINYLQEALYGETIVS